MCASSCYLLNAPIITPCWRIQLLEMCTCVTIPSNILYCQQCNELDPYDEESNGMKRLNLLGLGIGVGTGLLVGFALPFLLFWYILYNLRKSVELAKTGTRVTATVTRVITHNVKSYNFNSKDFTYEGHTPKKGYSLVARWQNPQTGKTYTLRSPVRNAEKFPVGSPVAFLIDPQHPKRHLLDTRNM